NADYDGRTGLRRLIRVLRRSSVPFASYHLFQLAILRCAEMLYPRAALGVAALAKHYRVPLMEVTRVNSGAVISFIRAVSPALLISVSCPQRIEAELLSSSALGGINIHASLLPAYAGMAPYIAVLADGKHETGISVHYLTHKLDAGNILVQRNFAIGAGTSAYSLFLSLAQLGSAALVEGVQLALAGAPGQPQNLAARSYRSYPTHKAYRKLRAQGFWLIRVRELLNTIIAECLYFRRTPRC